MRDDGGPAFPHDVTSVTFRGDEEAILIGQGMSLRDYFAAKALPVAYSMAEKCYRDSPEPKTIAEWAYEVADAMLAARSA